MKTSASRALLIAFWIVAAFCGGVAVFCAWMLTSRLFLFADARPASRISFGCETQIYVAEAAGSLESSELEILRNEMQLRFNLRGEEILNETAAGAILKLGALRDKRAGVIARALIEKRVESQLPTSGLWPYVWLVVRTEEEQCSALLISMLSAGGPDARYASLCLQRLSFISADSVTAEDSVHFWENWMRVNDGKTWNQLYVDALKRNGVLRADSNEEVTTDLLLAAWDRFRLPIRRPPVYSLDGEASTSELIAMRTSELLCEHFDTFASPPSFPLSFVDSSYQGMELDWKEIGRNTEPVR